MADTLASPSQLNPAAFPARAVQRRAQASRARLWNAALLTIGLVVFDIYGYSVTAGATRYVLVALPILLVCAGRPNSNRLTLSAPLLPDYFLLALFVFGTIGSLYGLFAHTTTSPALPLFLPMACGFLHLTVIGNESEAEAVTNTRRLIWVLCAGVAVQAATAVGLTQLFGAATADPLTNPSAAAFGHERAFLVCAAVVGLWLLRRRRLMAAVMALGLVAFLSYPAATYVVAATMAILTLVAVDRRATKARALVIGLLALVMLLFVVVDVAHSGPGTRSSLGSAYSRTFGKGDNSETRADLWSKAWVQTQKSPVVGSGFAGDTSIRVLLAGQRRAVPPHNDFLQMGMGGGLLAMALLIGWVVSTNVTVVGRLALMRAEPDANRRVLATMLLVGYNCFFAVALSNPVMSRGGLNVILMLMYSLMMSVRPDAGTQLPTRATVRPA
jgi:hypothetical protein